MYSLVTLLLAMSTAPSPEGKVPKAPEERRLGWLALARKQRGLAGIATPWVSKFALAHPACLADRGRVPGISGKSGLQRRESDEMRQKPTH